MRDEIRAALMPLTLLSAATGSRTMAGITAVAPGRVTGLLAASELIADKVPGAPNRVDPALLFGRIAAGAIVGAMVGRRTGMNPGAAAAVGGLVAFASTHATYRLRLSLGERLPAIAAALVEDALVAGAAVAGAALLRERSPDGGPRGLTPKP